MPSPRPVCAAGLGQLLVWEWQSESYVLKQQGHPNSMVSLAYSPDGQYIVTGGDDGKVGLCRLGRAGRGAGGARPGREELRASRPDPLAGALGHRGQAPAAAFSLEFAGPPRFIWAGKPSWVCVERAQVSVPNWGSGPCASAAV